MNQKTTIVILVLAIVFLSFLDVGFNLLSFIPGIGPALETTSELILEILTIISGVALGLIGARGTK